MTYLLHILIFIGIYVILSESLNLIAGYTGLLSIAHAAFYGVGAYVAALLGLHYHMPLMASLGLAVVGTVLVAVAVAAPSVRIHDDYFVVATFGLQVILFSIMNNWVSLTRGPLGLPGIPRPEPFGVSLRPHLLYLLFVAVFAIITHLLCRALVRAPFGRVLRAIRDDEVFTQARGKPVVHYKVMVFAIGGAFAAVAGCLYAWYITFIDPTSFTVDESIFLLTIVIIGGAGNLWGSVIGAALLISLPEALRFVGMPNAIAANVRQIIYGLALVFFMLFRPRGLIGEKLIAYERPAERMP